MSRDGGTECHQHGHVICKWCHIEMECLQGHGAGYYEADECDDCSDDYDQEVEETHEVE